MVEATEEGPRPRRLWRWLGVVLRASAALGVVAVICLLGAGQFQDKLKIVKPIKSVGHADEAAYAIMGENINAGRGLQVDYVSWFFEPYSPDVTRREDHWPPFMGLSIAPCFRFLGKSAWAAKVPAMAYASIGLPLTTALLAFALSRRGYVAIVAGLLMMAHPSMYDESLKTLSDVATAMLLAGFCGSVILAQRYRWMHLAAGVFLALAYFSKGSEMMLLGLYPIMTMLACGWRAVIRRWFWLGMATALLLIAPYWYGNWRAYGNPLHSTQNYVSGFFDFESWEDGAYYPYWGHNVPKTSDRWEKYAKSYWMVTLRQRELAARISLTGEYASAAIWNDFGSWGQWACKELGGTPDMRVVSARPPPQPTLVQRLLGAKPPPPPPPVMPGSIKPIGQWQAPTGELPAVGSVILVLLLLAAWPVMLTGVFVRWWWGRRGQKQRDRAQTSGAGGADAKAADAPPPAVKDAGTATATIGKKDKKPYTPPWMIGPVMALVLVYAAHLFFLSYLWQVQSRFCFVFLPLLAAMGCTLGSRLVEWPLYGLGFMVARAIRFFVHRPAPGWLRSTGVVLRMWPVMLTLAAVVFMVVNRDVVARDIKRWAAADRYGGMMFGDEEYVVVGKWFAAKYPNAVIMCRQPWVMKFFCGGTIKTVNLPNPRDTGALGGQQIFAIAKYYKVTHLFVDETRPSMSPYLSGRLQGLKRVPGAPGPVYEIDWNKLVVGPIDKVLAPALKPPFPYSSR